MNNSVAAFVQVAPEQPRSKWLLLWMILSQLMALLLILAGAAFALLGILLDGHLDMYAFFYFASPLFMLIPMVASWFAYGKRKQKLALVLTSLPILYVCLDLTIWVGGMVGLFG